MGWKHIGFSGDSHWERTATSTTERNKPHKLADYWPGWVTAAPA
jgi:hypothetical protein